MMIFADIVDFSHRLVALKGGEGDFLIDATMGNGNDTLFLARLAGPTGRVFAFDIQKKAIAKTESLLAREGFETQVSLFRECHSRMENLLPEEAKGKIKAIIYNLGYLPGGDKGVTTVTDSTIEALKASLNILEGGGMVVIVAYPGHPEGKEESQAIEQWMTTLERREYTAFSYRLLNRTPHAPYILVIEKAQS